MAHASGHARVARQARPGRYPQCRTDLRTAVGESTRHRSLHPQAIRSTWIWSRADEICDEIRIAPGVLDDSVRQTPFSRARMSGQGFQGDTRHADFDLADPILGDLPLRGMTHYAILPLGARLQGRFDVLVVATARPEGFPPAILAACERLFVVFALHVARHVTSRMLTNVVRTYLGRDAGERVLDGSIRRGSGPAGVAVIWVLDLRGFTQLTDNHFRRQCSQISEQLEDLGDHVSIGIADAQRIYCLAT